MFQRSEISAFLFDMDGLLLDTERLAWRCWSEAAREFGYELPLDTFRLMIGRRVADNESLVKKDMGHEFPYWEVRTRRVEIMEQYINADGVPVKAGARGLLQALAQLDFPVAVVTSTETAVAERKLAEAELSSFLRFVVGPESVTQGKPHPDCYLHAARELGVTPKSCVVLEDSPAGVEAGLAAGMKVVWVPDLVLPTEELATRVDLLAEDLIVVHHRLRETIPLAQPE